MNKILLYAIFIIKFLFGLGLIWWTVAMTMSSDTGEDEDNAFLSTYHKVDDNFNNIIIGNIKFSEKYNIGISINNTTIKELVIKDVFLGQRSIRERKTRKNILKFGDNILKFKISSKNNKKIKNAKLKVLVTMGTNHLFDKKLEFKQNEIKNIKISKKGYWNLTGIIEVGNDKGYFFIKTNAR